MMKKEVGKYKFTILLTEGKQAYFDIPWPITKDDLLQIKKQVELMCEMGMQNHKTKIEEQERMLKQQLKAVRNSK